MPAANTDKFIKVASNTGWQLNASGISDASVTSFGLVSATSLPTDTAVILTIDRVNSSGVATPSLMERIVGVMSGTTVTSCVRGLEGTAQAHAAGAVVEIVISKSNINKLMEGILVEHGQDGKHTFSGLTSKTTPIDADSLPIVDSAASNVLKQVTWANVKATLLTYFNALFSGKDGWTPVSDSWTYASSTTITVPTGAASLYQKGDKIKLTANSVVLYVYVASVADTVLTVIGNSLTNHAFSNIYVSRAESPFGFPTTFSYTPTFASSGTQPVLGSSTIAGKFWIKGSVCWYTGKLTVTTGGAWSAGTGTYRFGLPITSSAQAYVGTGTMFDNGTAEYPAMPETTASAAYCTLKQASNGNLAGATTPMTPATGDYYVWTGFFDF